MGDEDRKKVERSGAFLAPGGTTPAPVGTLSDEYHDTPEPEDSDRVPEPEPEGAITRAVHRLVRKPPRESG